LLYAGDFEKDLEKDFYFIRTSSIYENKLPSYSVINKIFKLKELDEFYKILFDAVYNKNPDYTNNIKTLKNYLDNIIFITKK
jgi:hypothetical protein